MYKSKELLHKRLLQMAMRRGFQAELARKMGVSAATVQNYLAGKRSPGLDQLDSFAKALDIDPWELIKPETETPRDESFERIALLWKGFDEYQRTLASALFEDLAKVPHNHGESIGQNKKSGA